MELTSELNAKEGSFLLELRSGMSWDHQSFMNLITKLYAYCQSNKEAKLLERSMASPIWTMSVFVKSWAEHPNFPKQQSAEYYAKSYELLDDLLEFYINGYSAYMDDEHILVKIEHFNSMARP